MKKSTTYTMLKRLCQRGLFENTGGQVTVLMSREDFSALQGETFLQESFGGLLRLPAATSSAMRRSSSCGR